ncbi:MAG TPA: zinc ribbon domain-containing protein [Gemmatimonadaceae bacterium]|nr:zinc ribbon domain-containing protein [Gemmatimonadaceae bacterium]
MKKYCNFCGAPLKDSAKECEQCGWDRSQDGPPSSDPADTKARIGVAAGLAVAYAVMFTLIQGMPDVARATTAMTPTYSAENITAPAGEPNVAPPIAIAASPTTIAAGPATVAGKTKLLTIKVADGKTARIQAHNALNYDFDVPETAQKCQLVGQLHGAGGFDRDLETFLLTDDEYMLWHANPAAIPHSSWDTIRGSETSLSYNLPGPGTYHLVISNEMSPTDKTVQVKALVKCAR